MYRLLIFPIADTRCGCNGHNSYHKLVVQRLSRAPAFNVACQSFFHETNVTGRSAPKPRHRRQTCP